MLLQLCARRGAAETTGHWSHLPEQQHMSAMLRARFSASSLLNTQGPTRTALGVGSLEPRLWNLSAASLQVVTTPGTEDQ
jgi:hypothetical protein